MIVLFLTGMVAMIMMRTLHADLRRYNRTDINSDDAEEETGWKLVHGDVFRPPNHPMLLSVLVGSGIQVFGGALITMSNSHCSLFSIHMLYCSICSVGLLVTCESRRTHDCCGGALCGDGVTLSASIDRHTLTLHVQCVCRLLLQQNVQDVQGIGLEEKHYHGTDISIAISILFTHQ
jgi:hypothetical protein